MATCIMYSHTFRQGDRWHGALPSSGIPGNESNQRLLFTLQRFATIRSAPLAPNIGSFSQNLLFEVTQ
jgi:hypothetical protein